jgi:hypothetical protein
MKAVVGRDVWVHFCRWMSYFDLNPVSGTVPLLTNTWKKYSDWLRVVQFYWNTVAKYIIHCQKSNASQVPKQKTCWCKVWILTCSSELVLIKLSYVIQMSEWIIYFACDRYCTCIMSSLIIWKYIYAHEISDESLKELHTCILTRNSYRSLYRNCYRNFYLTISRRRRGDYKPIFTEPKAKWI